MNVQERIQHLQTRRHFLLNRRDEPDASVVTLDMELNIVRSELLALYEISRHSREARKVS